MKGKSQMTNKVNRKPAVIGAIVFLIIVLGMTACGPSVDASQVVGTYKGSWEYNGTEYLVTITLIEAGDYYKTTGIGGSFSVDDGKFNGNGKRINLHSNNSRVVNSGYEWKDGSLYTNGHKLEKQQ